MSARSVGRLRSCAPTQTSRAELIDTLLELGDWYQLAGDQRNALRTYRELWGVLQASGALETQFLGTATPLLFRPRTGVALRRAPLERDDYRRYTVDMDYGVNRNGWVRNVTVTESNAPQGVQDEAIEDLRYLRHRPRFVDGEPVDAAGLHFRQNIYVSTAEREPVATTRRCRVSGPWTPIPEPLHSRRRAACTYRVARSDVSERITPIPHADFLARGRNDLHPVTTRP